jgi:NAD(P)-dependent dehydrogenase (short-subunit alcohol dehydrogenase family)
MRLKNNEVPRIAVLLGGTKGIGRATAIALAAEGWRTLIVGRDRVAGEALVKTLGGGSCFFAADLSSMSSVRALAALVLESAPRIDLVVHSADVLRTTRVATPEGIEVSFATNFLGRVLFNHLVLDSLSDTATIVHVAAAGLPGGLTAEDVPPGPKVSAMSAHNLGQRANDAYGLELAERLRGRGVRVVVLNPGMVATGIRDSPEPKPWYVRLLVAALTWLAAPWTLAADVYAGRLVAFLSAPPAGAHHVLYDRSFRPITPRRRFRDAALRRAVWRRAHDAVGASTFDDAPVATHTHGGQT